MSDQPFQIGEYVRLSKDSLQLLLDELMNRKYTIIGPVAKDGGIVYDMISSVEELPEGYVDFQEAGTYRLTKDGRKDVFGFVIGPNAWKRYLYPPEKKLWEAKREGKDFRIEPDSDDSPAYAFVGVRPCDLEAIHRYDRIFMHDAYPEKTYARRRTPLFVIAVNCTQPANTCFCSSMGTGPKASKGFDLALTEMHENGSHYFLCQIGSEQGAEVARNAGGAKASDAMIAHADKATSYASSNMKRSLNTNGLREALYKNYESPRWDKVAERCLTCGNCTMVCPTCFCTTIEDYTDLTGNTARRIRKWDSCYNNEFSYIHGGSVRTSAYARYRHWLVHKLAAWYDQYGASGCVGCGRCITWCPVGIDITEEANAILHSTTS